MRELVINNHRIADDLPPYVIAELGNNHSGSFEIARQMIQTAKVCGAQAVKLQKRDVETLYSRQMLEAPYENENSYGKTYGEHRRALEFGAREYLACRSVAISCGIDFFATAFDEPSVDFLMQVDVPAIKIASAGIQDHRLLKYAASMGKPLVVSTGGCLWDNVDDAVDLLSGTTTPFALLHCTASYPVRNAAELNLRCVATMRERYPDIVIGWSGHDPGISLTQVAYTYGARIIEKHFTLDRSAKGTDHAFSLEPKGLMTMCEDLRKAHIAVGDGEKRVYDSEKAPLSKMRRVETPMGPKVTGQHATH